MSEEDRMAAEWAAALDESKAARPAPAGGQRGGRAAAQTVAPAAFTNFRRRAATCRPVPATTST
jgi:flagellar motor switch protein FliN/FliY